VEKTHSMIGYHRG